MKTQLVEAVPGKWSVVFWPTPETGPYTRNANGEYFTLAEAQEIENGLKQKGALWGSHTGYQVWRWSKHGKQWLVKGFKTLPEAVRYAQQNPRIYKVVDGELAAPVSQPGTLVWTNGTYCRRAWPHALASARRIQ